jgi:site-specific recombinase XerC
VVDVKSSAVRAWVSKMVAEDVGTPTIENTFGLLRQVLGAAVEDRRIPRNPCEGVRLPKRKHADRGCLSHAQVAALAAAVDRQAGGCAVPGLHRVAVGRWRTAGTRF